MSRILHLQKSLTAGPDPLTVPGVTIRPFNGATSATTNADARAWLALREAAFAGMLAAGRSWTIDDFDRELTAKPWWSPERTLLACISDGEPDSIVGPIVGSITLGRTGRPPHDSASVMWLMVRPEWRDRGIGQALLSTIEGLALAQEESILTLETHVEWQAAVRLYRAAGYTT
ncbi:MAG: GNAT family N-acetyltransferase [Planctomycetia bacterium]|nr:GNAT family N-acetyltransferase [Planctomycetia bacterium]